ncbi:MAG: hypothetical protein FWE45_04880 [Firmicutes bacterium]|nr:hypothetical protein [Bacillota bacterium]
MKNFIEKLKENLVKTSAFGIWLLGGIFVLSLFISEASFVGQSMQYDGERWPGYSAAMSTAWFSFFLNIVIVFALGLMIYMIGIWYENKFPRPVKEEPYQPYVAPQQVPQPMHQPEPQPQVQLEQMQPRQEFQPTPEPMQQVQPEPLDEQTDFRPQPAPESTPPPRPGLQPLVDTPLDEIDEEPKSMFDD